MMSQPSGSQTNKNTPSPLLLKHLQVVHKADGTTAEGLHSLHNKVSAELVLQAGLRSRSGSDPNSDLHHLDLGELLQLLSAVVKRMAEILTHQRDELRCGKNQLEIRNLIYILP